MKRLTPATVTFLMFGVVGLLVAAYVAKGLMAREAPKPPETRLMPVPISDIPAGTLITREHIGRAPFRPSLLESDMIINQDTIVGRIAKNDLVKAKPIVGRDLYPFGTTPDLKVGKGLRAYTVGVTGTPLIIDLLIKPGEHVDVQYQPSNNADRRFRGGVVITLLRGLKVLAINRQTKQSQPHETNTLTLEVTPVEASMLDLARTHGVLSFRFNPEGKVVNEVSFKDPTRITLEEMLGLPEIVDPKPPQPFTAQLYRQSSRQQTQFYDDGRVVDGSGTYIPAPTLPDRRLDPRSFQAPIDSGTPVAPSVTPGPTSPAAPMPAPRAPGLPLDDSGVQTRKLPAGAKA